MVASNTGGTSRDRRLPDDVVADLLGEDRRRYALETLCREERGMSVDDLAAEVCARERDTTPDDVEREERQEVRDELFQRHLPKLTATDVVTYDSMLGTLEITDRESFCDALEDP